MRNMLRKVADFMNRLVADRPPSKTYSANYIPNSDGEGGKVISTSGMN